MILEIATHGSVLKREHDSFVIANESGKTEMPAEKVDAIILTANALVSTQAISLCIEKQIQLVIASWSGRPLARMWVSTPGRATEIRRQQYLKQETEAGFQMAQAIIEKKLKRQRKFLIDLKNNRDYVVPELETALSVILSAAGKVTAISHSESAKQTMLGLEGTSAAAYFRALSACLPSKWTFERRSQHPAVDGFNSVLNYSYGIGYSTMEKVIILSGMDPNCGFLHSDTYAKPTLSFDLMELVRPTIDRMVVTLFNRKMVEDSWFEPVIYPNAKGIYLSKVGRGVVLASYGESCRKEVEEEGWKACKDMVSTLVGDSS